MPGRPPSGAAWRDPATHFGETPAFEKAISALLADSTLRRLVSAHAGWIETGGTWFTCQKRPVGTVLTVRFASPVTFTANLPVVVKPSGPSAYAVAVNKVAARGARELTVSVDTSLAKVVGVRPLAWPTTPGPEPATALATISPPHDQGGPDTQNSRHIDIWKLKLEPGRTDFVRLTHWGDYEGYKASNPVVSNDGKRIAFQSARNDEPAGVGHGIFILTLK